MPDGKAISTSPPGAPASHPLPAPFAYGAALAGVALCTLLRWPLQPLIGNSNSYTLFYPAILVVSWFGGLGAGLAATLLSALAADLFFLSPRIGLTAPGRPAVINLLLFLVVGAALARITTGWRRAEALRRTELGRRQREQELHRLGNERLYRAAHEARAAAEAASRSKDEFLATISHELRTPLNAMMGWAQLLQMNRGDEQRTATGLETILRNARVQAQLIDDLLDLSRIVSGKMRLDVRALDLTKVIEGAVEAVRPAAEAKAIGLVQSLDPRAGPVAGDPDRLQQVVWNLLSNAVKFTPTNGRVEIRLERVNSHLEIMVADNGTGIGAEALPFVFERFWQTGAATRTHGGLGLGLAIVRHLVELHGGTVAVSSPGDGQGTTFLVRLPQSG